MQFLDFGLQLSDTPARRQFVRQTANGPLLRLNVDGNSGKFLLYPEDGGAAEVVRPESDIALADSLSLLSACWLPLPMLRCASGRRLIGGPENWARMRLVALPAPDAAGNTHRVSPAFDTRCVAEQDGGEQLGLSPADAQNGVTFALARHNYELGDFLDLTRVDGWLRESFTDRVSDRREQAINQALREFEYRAHYLNLLELLGEQLDLSEIHIQAATLQTPAVNVDIILDVGNSHTCGILVEDHPEESNGLKQTYELQLRRSVAAASGLQRAV